jgi:hypothetical protein
VFVCVYVCVCVCMSEIRSHAGGRFYMTKAGLLSSPYFFYDSAGTTDRTHADARDQQCAREQYGVGRKRCGLGHLILKPPGRRLVLPRAPFLPLPRCRDPLDRPTETSARAVLEHDMQNLT